MVGSFVIRGFGEDLDEGFIFITTSFEIFGIFGGMSGIVEEKLAEGN